MDHPDEMSVKEPKMNQDPPSQHELDNHANQLNEQHPDYHRSRGASPEEAQRLASEARAESARRSGQASHEAKPVVVQRSGSTKR
ncbi:hypothetical protein BE11_22320 [Sorangium cellulosum]|nr:hypothetical protein BE11_22320 [Sorangium cellulosum]